MCDEKNDTLKMQSCAHEPGQAFSSNNAHDGPMVTIKKYSHAAPDKEIITVVLSYHA
jgi:hypothetical protein